MATRHVIVIDDSQEMGETLVRYLAGHGFSAQSFVSVPDALARIAQGGADVVLTDLRMPGQDGMDVLDAVRAIDARLPVVIMTAFGAVDSAVEAMRRGAFHYLTKPFKLEVVRLLLDRAVTERSLSDENVSLKARLEELTGFGAMVGSSPAMRALYTFIQRVAQVAMPVLIQGETGCGKELVARAIHDASPRRERPFVAVNCAAVPDQLLESELFGHVRGAFTGASQPRKGLMLEADGGTLLLDEIGEMPLALQAKLLRVLESGEVRAVGSDGSRTVDVRVIAATHRDLPLMVAEGRFREDLFYRLKVIPLRIPALRDHPEDIPDLVEHFLRRAEARGGERMTLTPAAMQVLMKHPWPGNVRELSHLIDRLSVVTTSPRVDDPLVRSLLDGPDAQQILAQARVKLPTLAQLEEEYTQVVLDHVGGNRTRACEILGIDPSTLYRRMRARSS